VSCEDAKAFTAWLSARSGQDYRLLTEAEWEYVARAGTATPFWWGSTISPQQANYNGSYLYGNGGAEGEYREQTVAVANFPANPWGLFQVHGNVLEWCEDVWHDNYDGAPSNGSAWLEGGNAYSHVVRGGSWLSFPQDIRSAFRAKASAILRIDNLGFRVRRTPNS
jgi:formylglycine-generating enzyme required for sulfatase activity